QADLVDDAAAGTGAQCRLGLLLDHVGQRTRRRGQRHVHGRDVPVVDVDAIDEAEIHDVDAQFRVDHVLERLLDVVERGLRGGGPGGQGVFAHADPPTFVVSVAACARTSASLNAIHGSSAHFTRAGYFATPANATPSSRSSSSGSPPSRPATMSVNAS